MKDEGRGNHPTPPAFSAFILRSSSFILCSWFASTASPSPSGANPRSNPFRWRSRKGEVFGLARPQRRGQEHDLRAAAGSPAPERRRGVRPRSFRAARPHAHALQRVGAIFETPAFYDYLSGWRNLQIITAFSGRVGRAEMEEAVRFVGLEKRILDPGARLQPRDAPAARAGPGTAARAGSDPVLDEPAEGLDPEGIREMRELILRLNRERGLTVVLSSHLLGEVEQTCGRVAILNRGRLVFQGHWDEAGRQTVARFHLEVDDWAKGERRSSRHTKARWIDAAGRQTHRRAAAGPRRGRPRRGAGRGMGVRVRAVEPVRQSLEEVYLRTVAAAAPPATACCCPLMISLFFLQL